MNGGTPARCSLAAAEVPKASVAQVMRSLQVARADQGGILAHGSSPCSPSNGTEWLTRHLRPERELRRGERILFVGTASQRDEFERAFK